MYGCWGRVLGVREEFIDRRHLDKLTGILRPKTSMGLGSNRALSPMTGFPALTVPAGFTTDVLPVGLEFLGRPFTEAMLLNFAYAYEPCSSTPSTLSCAMAPAPASTPTVKSVSWPASASSAARISRAGNRFYAVSSNEVCVASSSSSRMISPDC